MSNDIKIIIIFLVFVILFVGVLRAEDNTDDLESRLAAAVGKERVEILLKLVKLHTDRNPKEAIEYGKEGLASAERIGSKRLIVELSNSLCRACILVGDLTGALDYGKQGLVTARTTGDERLLAGAYMANGGIVYSLGNFDSALEYYLQALQASEKIDDPNGIAQALNGLGATYSNIGNFLKASESYSSALEIRRKLQDKRGIADLLNNLAYNYWRLKNFKKMLEYAELALKSFEELGETGSTAYPLGQIGMAHCELGNLNLALNYLLKSNEIFEKNDIKKGLAYSYKEIGRVYTKKRLYPRALESLEKGLEISLKHQFKDYASEFYKNISKVYSELKDYKQAFLYYQKFKETNDEIFNSESNKRFAQLQTLYEKDKREKEIELLKKDQSVRDIALKQQKTQTKGLIFGVLLLTGIVILLINLYRLKVRSNREILEKNRMIAEKNRNIMSSISYARGIQQVMLPTQHMLNGALPEYFLVFEPRDMVSGDFYWFHETNGKRVVAVVDCTGHGVPGALLTMIVNILLDEIVRRDGVLEPAQVLQHLHTQVRALLRQGNKEIYSRDTMDVCLCVLKPCSSRENGVCLTFAGAGRPLYIVRQKKNQFTEIKGDRRVVGGRQVERRRFYAQHEINLEKGDMVYLTTDGYADQQNIQEKKYTSRRLKSFLTVISSFPVETQGKYLLEDLAEFRGVEEQRDDITIFGIRV
jgi:serine phosphatase RsbU (regulator of sigma subunit)